MRASRISRHPSGRFAGSLSSLFRSLFPRRRKFPAPGTGNSLSFSRINRESGTGNFTVRNREITRPEQRRPTTRLQAAAERRLPLFPAVIPLFRRTAAPMTAPSFRAEAASRPQTRNPAAPTSTLRTTPASSVAFAGFRLSVRCADCGRNDGRWGGSRCSPLLSRCSANSGAAVALPPNVKDRRCVPGRARPRRPGIAHWFAGARKRLSGDRKRSATAIQSPC